jgi:hypothetical protein
MATHGGSYANPSPSLAPSPGQRAQYELLVDPQRSDMIIAGIARCHRETVTKARRYLEGLGEIEPVGAWDRKRASKHVKPEWWAQLPPRPTSMDRGLCVAHPDPDLWNSGLEPAKRTEAIRICLTPCPALADCAEWSLCLPSTEKFAIYGGMSASERSRRRRQRQREVATEPS